MYSPCLTPLSCPSSYVTPSVHPSQTCPTVLISISHAWCSSRPSLCPPRAQNVPVLLSLWAFPYTFHAWITHLIFLTLRWGAICWDISWLYGAGLCHLSYSWQASPNQDRATRLPMAEWWEPFEWVAFIYRLWEALPTIFSEFKWS